MNKEEIDKLINIIKTQYDNITGIIIDKNNDIEFEYYNNDYCDVDTFHIASVTKSLISILIGIAIDKGGIKSIDQKVLEFFPEYKLKRGEKTIQEITIRNLLTMTAPYKFKSEPYTKVYSSEDWTTAALDLLGGKGNIGEFKYTTVGLQILSGILVNATGQPLVEFINENLFSPLAINKTQNKKINNKEEHIGFLKDKKVMGWVVDPKGTNTAGWGLSLSTLDLLKVGKLYLNDGKWKDKQIVSSEWIKESTKEHSRWEDKPYGYLWWILKGFGENCFAAIGDGGNIIFIHPEKKIVIAITSSFMPRAKDRIELIEKIIYPLLKV
ncbi:serine hydrolase domain-containing protein [Spirochaeta cellobiosiphila]|uniref:serine hydrolase domain-containing protein n=1 Tax=Spirochaeta cellobiosiphila TaxID=504483 RepID=UPI0003FD1CD0|nr:serine hydrolase [Spirochaeta cellobiosiphila]